MNSYEKNMGNVSLPPRLQPPDFNPDKLKEIIVNTQKAFYNLKITETNKRIQRYLLKKHSEFLLRHLH